jgi:molybdopterin synthase sulfur carrier subunit
MAKVSLRIYAPLAQQTGTSSGSGRLTLEEEVGEGEQVSHLLHRLADRYGEGFREALFHAETGQIRQHLNVLVNGQSLAFMQGVETELRDGDELVFLPAYAGG